MTQGRVDFDDKVVALHLLLARRAIPHAFGGAIAQNYWGEPRATTDIDINIFVSNDVPEQVLAVFEESFRIEDMEAQVRAIKSSAQG